MFIQGIKNAIKTLKILLNVKPLSNNYAYTDEEIKSLSINFWNKSNVGTEMKNQNKGIFGC